jgi:hypothetical protein
MNAGAAPSQGYKPGNYGFAGNSYNGMSRSANIVMNAAGTSSAEPSGDSSQPLVSKKEDQAEIN